MPTGADAEQVARLLTYDAYTLWLSQWPFDFIVGRTASAAEEPIAQYLLLTTGEPYWLDEGEVMLGEQPICPVPAWVQSLCHVLPLVARQQEISVGRMCAALNQIRRGSGRSQPRTSRFLVPARRW